MNNTGIYSAVRFSSIFVLIFGTLCNFLIITVLCSTAMREYRIAPHLISLAVVDIITLWVNVLKLITESYGFEYSISVLTLVILVTSVLNEMSSWLTVMISIERMLAVYCPFLILNSANKTHWFIIAGSILLFSLLVINTTLLYCGFASVKLITLILSTLYSFMPATLLVISNILMLYRLLRRPNLGQNNQRSTQSRDTLCLVICLNGIFLCTTVPVAIIANLYQYKPRRVPFLISDFIACLNNSLNFLAYVCISKQFRETTKKIFSRQK